MLGAALTGFIALILRAIGAALTGFFALFWGTIGAALTGFFALMFSFHFFVQSISDVFSL